MAQDASPTGTADPVSVLYFTLISAESWTRVFGRELVRLQQWMSRAPEPPDFLYPSPPPGGRRPREELMVDLGRGPMLHHHAPWVRRYDAYHDLESRWRERVYRAEQAVVDAAAVLDQPGEPLLQRTTTPLRRALMELRCSVPSTAETGDQPPTDPQVVPLLWERLRPVSKWVDDLRLLRPPQAPMVLSGKAPESPCDPEWQALDFDQQVVLQTLLEQGATPEGRRVSAKILAKKAIDRQARSSIEPILKALEESGYVDPARGRYGGWRLTKKGHALVLRNVKGAG